jgi:hypothetical protein
MLEMLIKIVLYLRPLGISQFTQTVQMYGLVMDRNTLSL